MITLAVVEDASEARVASPVLVKARRDFVLELGPQRRCNGALPARARCSAAGPSSMAELESQAGSNPAGDSSFRTTHWSVVLGARDTNSPQARQALTRICQAYWYPLYAFVRRYGHSPQDAQDLIQGFFARVLEKGSLHTADKAKGKFRSFLLLALKRYMTNEWVRDHREKRGGNLEIVPLDHDGLEEQFLKEPTADSNPEKAYDRRWAIALLSQVLVRLREEYSTTEQARLFGELEGFLNGEAEPSEYAQIGQRLGMSPGTLRVAVHRLRTRFRELLRLEIAGTVDSSEQIDEEIRELHLALR